MLRLILLLCFIVLGGALHTNHIEIRKQLRQWKDISGEVFTNSVRKLKMDLFGLRDLSGLQNLTVECAEDIMLVGLALNGSDLIPPDFLQTVAMGKSINKIYLYE